MTISVGDRVKVVKPDSSGVSNILAAYDAPYLVTEVHQFRLRLETRLTGMPDGAFVYRIEVVKVEDRPWWEKTGEAGT